GHLHVYVTEINSSDWYDTYDDPYTFAFLDYAWNEDVPISQGSTWDDSTDWDGEDYHDGYGNRFENITQNNTMVIATVFDEDNDDYSDETTGFVAGVGTDPKTFDLYFGNSTPPPKETSNSTLMEWIPPNWLDWDTTYYWKVDVWDNNGNPTYGDIWNFTTRNNTAPIEPWAPNPPDNSTDAPINTILSWKCSDPERDDVYYDVYFGETSPEDPPKVASNITINKYKPNRLDFDKGYEWRIVAWDEYGFGISGAEWSFRTQENEPPYEASNPYPPDGANDVPLGAILNWTGGDPNPGDLVRFDVYFGRINPPTKKVSNTTKTNYTPEPPLEEYQEYYWRIVTWDIMSYKTVGPIWTFQTGENHKPNRPTITGPREVKVGEVHTYNFSTTDPDGQNISYYIEWGDGTTTGWLGPYYSGTTINSSHSWDDRKEFTIRCKAKDHPNEEESDWGTLKVTVPKTKQSAPVTFYQFLQKLIQQFPLLEKVFSLFLVFNKYIQ
ncbi:MAG: hypothetical protein JSW00_06635, partial [Thermoplasmata archaeon]